VHRPIRDGIGSAVEGLVSTVAAVAAVVLAGAPVFILRLAGMPAPVPVATLLFGLGIVGAAFAMSWGAEAAEHDIPRALALIAVALLAVLPEYAVDIVFAWKAGSDPSFAAYATANMTGSNRLLLGLGWPAVSILAWLVHRTRVVHVERTSEPAWVFLALATAYSFTLPLKGSISLVDSAILVALFAVYALIASRSGVEEPELVGPAARIAELPAVQRRLAVLGLFAFATATIAAAAEPFAEGLVHTGSALGVDEFLLVQWLAPLASEAPEFLVAALLAVRGKAGTGLALLVSAKVNQWTLLVSSLPIAYSLGAGAPGSLPLDGRQTAEVLLTAAQSLFGLGVLASMSLSVRESLLLAALFLAQLVLGGVLRTTLHDSSAASAELFAFAGLYVLLGAAYLLAAARTIVRVTRDTVAFSRAQR
jgi:cation:H+ antiporter